MHVKTTDGSMKEIHEDEAMRIYREMDKKMGEGKEHYQEKTKELMKKAQTELMEATGDSPENMKEMFAFAVKYELFGDREETHVMLNFLKLLYAMLQKETHS